MLSDTGRVRRGNEDACASAHGRGLQAFVVCDGMGGAAAGEVASRLAASTFISSLTSPDPSQHVPHGPRTQLESAVQAANTAVFRFSRQSAELNGMGTTLVGIMYLTPDASFRNGSARPVLPHHGPPPRLWIANVGDSRCYLWRDGALSQLTADHSVVEEQVRAGQITPDQAALSPMRNLITRAIGSHHSVEADIQAHHPRVGDLFLLATDGLTRDLSDLEIASTLTRLPHVSTPYDLQLLCRELIDAANRNGGHDNITVLLLAFPPPNPDAF